MVLKNEQHRIKALLTEAITVLCKNGLGYHYNFTIEGLLGITLDDEDIFLVNIKETIKKADRPPPEPPKSPSPEPPARSPGGPSRRRRRRSDNDYPNSPPKRAAMGSDVPRDSEDSGDVIVIKEEVTDSEVAAEFYGDSGGGFDQMQPEPQYMQGDPGAPGCSQWDQDQAASWQATAAQSFAASSSMLSTSMSSPSQMPTHHGESTLPSGTVKSPEARTMLDRYIVSPFQQPGYKVSAFRMSWFSPAGEYLHKVWSEIVHLRVKLDYMVTNLPGVDVCISAITATKSGLKKLQDPSERKLYPGVSYWIVTADAGFNERELFNTMQANPFGATMKLLLQPYQSTKKDLCTALYGVVKDNMEGCVRRMVDVSALQCLGQQAGQCPVVKGFAVNDQYIEALNEAQVNLKTARFDMVVE